MALSLAQLEARIAELESALAKQDQLIKDQQQAAKVQLVITQRQIDATRTASSGSTDAIFQAQIDKSAERVGAVVTSMANTGG